MDVDDQQQHQSRKRGRNVASNGGDARLTLHPMDVVDYEVDGGGISGLAPWTHSSRIIRVSRATGGKDRHSKVVTSKGLRDRRVRLSVSTAIQFYDLQDRLGYDQPSKAVDWLIKKASDAISELPSLNIAAFPTTPKQTNDEKRPEQEPEPEPELGESDQIHPFMTSGGGGYSNQQQPQHLTGSACSSTSETSKGSALSLSRSANRVKERERARERAAKEKEAPAPAKETDHGGPNHVFSNQSLNPSTSFSQLLTAGASSPTSSPLFTLPNSDHLFAKHFRQMSVMDYLGQQQPSFFSNFGSSSTSSTPSPPTLNALPFNISTSPGGGSRDHSNHHLQQFSFSPASTGADHHHLDGNEYNLNFSISHNLPGFTRGTLQSNAPPSLSHAHHQLHKFVSCMDSPPSPATPFFMSPAGTESNHYPGGLDGRLHLYHGGSCRHSDLKGKGKR